MGRVADNSCRASLNGLLKKTIAIDALAADGDEQISLRHLSAVKDDTLDIDIRRPLIGAAQFLCDLIDWNMIHGIIPH